MGSDLVRAALDEARSRGEIAVILLGAPSFYHRLGFEPASSLGWANPSVGVQQDGFVISEGDLQVAVIDDRARSVVGVVRWHPAFDAVG